jgi:hypothetical protein
VKTFATLLFATAPAVAALGFMTTNAMAGSSVHRQLQHAAAHHFARADLVRGSANDAPAYNKAWPIVPVYRGPGYAYIPGKGIPDEACDLPTSACPNEMRDAQ